MAFPSPGPKITPAGGRLNSWKEIAAYLGREVRTVQRWEETAGLPVHRLQHEKNKTVYALIGELDHWLASRSEIAEVEKPARGNAASTSRKTYWIAGITALVLIAGAALWIFRPADSKSIQLRQPVPVTSAPGYEYAPRLSPDGRSVAYTRNPNIQSREAVVQLIGQDTPASLGNPNEQTYSPAWSSQGEFIAFLSGTRWSPEPAKVIVRPALGGVRREIATVRTPDIFTVFAPGPYLDWSPDDRYLVACDRESSQPEHHLTLISIKTGEKRQLTTPPATAWGDYCPRFSPDGRRIVFSRTTGFGASRLYLLNLTSDMRSTGPPVQLPATHLWNAFPAWMPDGQHIIFAGGTMDHAVPRMIKADGSAPDTLAPISALGAGPMDLVKTRSGNDLRLVYTRMEINDDVARITLHGNPPQEDTAVPRARVLDSSYKDKFPKYSPDGSKIAFLSDRTGQEQLWICKSDGKEARQLTSFEEAQIGQSVWSPDGAQLAFAVQTKDETAIDVIDSNSGQARKLVAGVGTPEGPSWAPDGQWIYFSSKQDGRARIWKIPAQGGSQVEVISVEGSGPLLTPDSRNLIYTAGGVHMISLAGPRSTKILFPRTYARETVDVTASGVFAQVSPATSGDPFILSFYRFADGKTFNVAQTSGYIGNGLSISPDGRYALFTERRNVIMDIMMVDNWKPTF